MEGCLCTLLGPIRLVIYCRNFGVEFYGLEFYFKQIRIQTLRVFHLSYFKYILQISFNSFQFISSKFWKSVIFNLFEVSFLISNEINFLNKFFSEISMITSIITYSRTTDYLFFILSGKWVHDFWYQLFIFFYILSGKWLLNFWYWNLNILNIFIMWIHSWI